MALAGLTVLMLLLSSGRALAFSLLGPYEDWQTEAISFRLPNDIGGPRALGEEFRWNVPVLTYAFDQSFIDYFGAAGVAAVQAAIDQLNGLPPVSTVNLNDFPLDVVGLNPAAETAGLVDLKSTTLALLVEHLGLAQPTRYTFCLRDFVDFGGEFTAPVVMRHFDPLTLAVSSNVNSTVYTYELSRIPRPDALEVPIDPPAGIFNTVADRFLSPGKFYTGLSRDDIGGLIYLLHTNNVNREPLLPDAHGAGTNAGNYATTTSRPGVNKITFVPVDYNSVLGQISPPYTNQFFDRYLSNATIKIQTMERVLVQPDFLFTAEPSPAGTVPATLYTRTGVSNWLNAPGIGGPGGSSTPSGIITPPVKIAYRKFLPHVFTTDDSTAGSPSLSEMSWGVFDGSGNPPIALPTFNNGPELVVKFYLHPAGTNAPSARFDWQLPVPFGGTAALQMSADLNEWVTLTVVSNIGQPVEWDHTRSKDERYYRVVPQ